MSEGIALVAAVVLLLLGAGAYLNNRIEGIGHQLDRSERRVHKLQEVLRLDQQTLGMTLTNQQQLVKIVKGHIAKRP